MSNSDHSLNLADKPAPPSDLKATVEADGILLTFTTPEKVATRGRPIKTYTVRLGGGRENTVKLESNRSQQTFKFKFKYEKQQEHMTFWVCVTNTAEIRSEFVTQTVHLGKPTAPSNLTYKAEAEGIRFTFTTPAEGATGGCPINFFTWRLEGRTEKTEKIIHNSTLQTFTVKYIEKQTEYDVSVFTTNVARLNSSATNQTVCLGKPTAPSNLTYKAEAEGIRFTFTTPAERATGGCPINFFTWRLEGRTEKTEKIIHNSTLQTFTVKYIEKQTEYDVSVFTTNVARLNSSATNQTVCLGEPAPPSDLTLTAEEKEIVITFTLPVEGATGGSPIKSFTVCPVVGEIKGPFKTTFIKKEDHKQTSTFKYDGQQKEYAFSVSLTNAAGFISEELKEHICLEKPVSDQQCTIVVGPVTIPDAVTLSCTGMMRLGCPRGRVTWRHKRQIEEEILDKSHKHARHESLEFKIPRTEFAYEGDYTCEVSNHLGSCEVEFNLQVEGAPVLSRVTQQDVWVDYLSKITLVSRVQDNPKAQLQWCINDESIENKNGLQLIINHVVAKDVGVYTLKAKNIHGFCSINFNIRAKRHIIFVIAGISEDVSTIVQKLNSLRRIHKEDRNRPCEFVAIPYTWDGSREDRKDIEGDDNIAFGTFDHVYRGYSFLKRNNCANINILAKKVTDVIDEMKNPHITDSHSFLGVYAGGAALGDLFRLLKDERDIKWNTAVTYKSLKSLDQKIIPQLKHQKDYEITTLNCDQALDAVEKPDYTNKLLQTLESESGSWFHELNMLVCGELQNQAQKGRSFSPIMLAGFYKRTIEDVQNMLTNLLPDDTDKNSIFISAPMARASDFGEHMQTTQGMRKCIIVATFTERMNLLHEGADSGQVTAVYYEAQKRKMEILLLCMGLPKSQYSMKKEEARLYHQQLSALFRTQTILHGLAKTERFISLLSGERLDKDQTEALNKFLDPVSIQEPPRTLRSYWGSVKEKMSSFDFSFN